MDAIAHLNERIDMTRLLAYYKFDDVRGDGGYIRACCKIHGGNNPSAFVVNTQDNLWFCHTGGCGGGDAFTLVQKMEDVTFLKSVQRLAEIFSIDIEDMEILERNNQTIKEMQKWISAMSSRKVDTPLPYEINVETKKVKKFRDFQPSTLEHFGLAFVKEIEVEKKKGETYTLKNRLLFPIYQNETLIGASLRRTNNADFPKWSHQPVRMKTSELLYNYDNVQGAQEIVVVEGMPDVWAFHEIDVPAVATFGAHLTLQQLRMLLRTGADITLAYDGDEAGREATMKAYSMLYKTTNTKIIEFGDGEDPASIPREELRRHYEQKSRSWR